MSRMTPFKVRLHVISPVHIGCDEVYEPTGFMVDKAAQKLIAFDPLDFVRSLNQTDRKKFMELCDKGTLESIVEIYKFMWQRTEVPQGHAVEVSKGFVDTIERVLTLPKDKVKQELNKFLVSRTSFLPADNAPYIPGSALKGSLRTGWLNHKNGGKNNKERKPEEALLGGTFATDPLRMVKISDLAPVTTPKTRICFAVNKKKKISKFQAKGGNIPQILEVILPESAVFEGIITLHRQEQGGGINNPVPVTLDFFANATSFFSKKMSDEELILKTINLPAGIAAKMKSSFGERLMKSVFPARIGRHSGAECVTIDGLRNIKILGKRVNGKQEYSSGPHSTTLWLAGDTPKAESNLLPFGWVALELLELDPAAPLWPERIITERETVTAVVAAPAVKAPPPPPPPELTVWSIAILTWSPGNQTLTVQHDGKKSEVKLAADRTLVPETLHKKLFVKRDAVKAVVTVEKQGNAWLIIKVEATI